jgi:Flp pilus assembly protein CpaB
MATGRRRGRAFIFIALILILLLVLGYAAISMTSGGIGIVGQPEPTPVVVLPTATPAAQVVNIVMSTQPITRGTIISQDSVGLVAMPAADYVEGSFYGNIEDVVGTRARYDLAPRTPISEALLVPAGGSVSSFDIPKGMVAISIPVGKLSSVSYGLQPGDHVNVIATLMLVDIDPNFQSILPNLTTSVTAPGQVDNASTSAATIASGIAGRAEFDPTLGTAIYVNPSEPQRPRMVSQTLIQDVVVLQLGIFEKPAPTPAPTAIPDPAAQPAQPVAATAVPPVPVPDVITLIVNPQDAVTINYLMLAGARLNLVMRAAGDDQRAQIEAVTLQFVLDQYNIPNPAKLPYSMQPRVDGFFNVIPPFPEAGAPVQAIPVAPQQ